MLSFVNAIDTTLVNRTKILVFVQLYIGIKRLRGEFLHCTQLDHIDKHPTLHYNKLCNLCCRIQRGRMMLRVCLLLASTVLQQYKLLWLHLYQCVQLNSVLLSSA